MREHTPGPWHVGMKPGPIVYGSDGAQVANLFVPMVPEAENRANARLIAAAPDLLAACEEAHKRGAHQTGAHDTGTRPDTCWLCAAIATAKEDTP